MKTIATVALPSHILDEIPGNRSAAISRAVEGMFQRGVAMTVAMALSRRMERGIKAENGTKTALSLDVDLRKGLKHTAELTGLTETLLIVYATEVFISTAIPSEA